MTPTERDTLAAPAPRTGVPAATAAGRSRSELVPEVQRAAIHVARLPQPAADTGPAAAEPVPSAPPTLRFVTEEARSARLNSLLVISALVAVLAVVVGVLIATTAVSGSSGSSRAAKPPVRWAAPHGTPAERARAAATAQAKRDRGTDAEWQDTIPAATPSGP